MDKKSLRIPLDPLDAAKKAVEIVLPSILEAMRNEMVSRKALAIEFLDPRCKEPTTLYAVQIHLDSDETLDTTRFADIAHRKALLSHRTHMDTAKVIQKCPHLLLPDDPPYEGGVYLDSGLVVATSAFKAYHDHMFSTMLGAAYIAQYKEMMANEVHGDYVGIE